MALTPLRDGDPSRIGKYRLAARLGAGGMGVVYLGTARDGTASPETAAAGGLVAIKALRPELSDDPDFRARFRREITALSRVRGTCTVRVLEADTESARPYLVTEYAPGPTLAEWASEHGPLSPPEMLLDLAVGLAEALVAIHAAGVVHRDLKPGNVLLTAQGPKVIDFGIAQTLDATSVTRTGVSVGSPGFMAPEQVRGQSGAPADIFAWGLTVAYAASGQPPFGTGPADVIFYRILHEEPDISAVPERLRPLVAAALARKPEDRPTAPDLMSALAADSPSVGLVEAMLARTWVMPAARYPDATVWRRPRARRPLARRHPLLTSMGAAAVLLGVVAAITVMSTAQHSGQSLAEWGSTPCPLPCQATPYLPTAFPPYATYQPPPYTTYPAPPGTTYSVPPSTAPVGTASASPSCQGADCPSVIPAPVNQMSGSPSQDVAWLELNGYQPVWTDPAWTNTGILSVIIARSLGPPATLRAFFFIWGTSMGTDVPDGDGSTSVRAIRLGPDEIDLRYQLRGTPASTADVRFKWLDSDQLIRLDPLPPAQYRNG
jgi:serine/threonine protein kinase